MFNKTYLKYLDALERFNRACDVLDKMQKATAATIKRLELNIEKSINEVLALEEELKKQDIDYKELIRLEGSKTVEIYNNIHLYEPITTEDIGVELLLEFVSKEVLVVKK